MLYMVMHFLAAQAAKYAALGLLGKTLVVSGDGSTVSVMCVELVYTFMLCYTVLNTACRKETTQYFGLAIGFVIVAGGYAVGGISGGAFNPAVASCVAIADMWKYFIAEFLGAALAAGATMVVYVPEAVGKASLVSKLTSEFIGTFMLVTTVGFNILGNSPAGALSIGMSLACMIFADGGVSGGNFNPAVTLAILIRGATDAATAGKYILTQLAAGAAAGAFYSYAKGGQTVLGSANREGDMMQASLAELVFTFVLCFVVLGVATVKNPQSSQFNGLTVGLCVVAGGNAAGAISGGSLNPAVSLGISMSGFASSAHALGMYVLAELVAGVFAALAFMVIFTGEKEVSARERRGYTVMPEP